MLSYQPDRTALIVVDSKNDFLSENGKAWPGLRDVCERVGTIPNMKRVLDAARAAQVHVMHAPMRTEPWDYTDWKHRNLTYDAMFESRLFEAGTWGEEFPADFAPLEGEVVATPHKTFDALHGTDLSAQLRQRDIDTVILCGMLTNTCVDSTGRDAVEQGFEVTFVSDAVATFTMEMQLATIEQNWPRYAHRIATTEELLDSLG